MFFFGKKIAKKKVSHFEDLKQKWTIKHQSLQRQLWGKHGKVLQEFAEKTKHVAMGSVAGLVLLASPGAALSSSIPQFIKEKPFKDIDKASAFLLELHQFLPQEVQPLALNEEQKIGELLTRTYGMQVHAELQGVRLNRSYGYIGQEQHLARFPGDTMNGHLTTDEDARLYASYGMAPGLGAWGYFARSASQMTEIDNQREKYYIAVQTFLAPGYLNNVKIMNDFFKYRKMLVVNPDNGKAIVAVIGDAGPAEWTGKSLGGSPEVMHYLERVDGAARGPVLYYFIDDPSDKIPLGPVPL